MLAMKWSLPAVVVCSVCLGGREKPDLEGRAFVTMVAHISWTLWTTEALSFAFELLIVNL